MTKSESRDLMIAHQRAASRYRREGDAARADQHTARAREFKALANA